MVKAVTIAENTSAEAYLSATASGGPPTTTPSPNESQAEAAPKNPNGAELSSSLGRDNHELVVDVELGKIVEEGKGIVEEQATNTSSSTPSSALSQERENQVNTTA